MEGNLNIYLKEKNSITNRPNKQAKQDKCKKGTKIQENCQNESVNGGNDKHIIFPSQKYPYYIYLI